MTEIIITAFLVGLIFAPLGCIVLWKRYVYFGDGLAHASILAGVLSVIMNLSILLVGPLIVICYSLAIFKFKISNSNNAAIGLTSSIFMSLALIISQFYSANINFYGLLFGNIIASNYQDIFGLLILLIIVALYIAIYYKQILLLVLNRDIANSRKVRIKMLDFCFLLILSLAILYTLKIVGALLVTSILIIPALAARQIARSPLQMILFSILIVIVMNIAGIFFSLFADLPFSPTIVICGGIIFILLYLCRIFACES